MTAALTFIRSSSPTTRLQSTASLDYISELLPELLISVFNKEIYSATELPFSGLLDFTFYYIT